jgi:hypothetical protein
MEHELRPQLTHPHNLYTVTFTNKGPAENGPLFFRASQELKRNADINKTLYSSFLGSFLVGTI